MKTSNQKKLNIFDKNSGDCEKPDLRKAKPHSENRSSISCIFEGCLTRQFNSRSFSGAAVLICLLTISIALTGCATGYAPVPGKTTFDDVSRKFGAPDKQVKLDGDVMRARWWRTAYTGSSTSGQRISVADTFYDGEFQQGGILRRWRTVNNSISLDDSYGFDLEGLGFDQKKVNWSVGYLTHDAKFVDDNRSRALDSLGLPNYQYLELNGTTYMGQVISR